VRLYLPPGSSKEPHATVELTAGPIQILLVVNHLHVLHSRKPLGGFAVARSVLGEGGGCLGRGSGDGGGGFGRLGFGPFQANGGHAGEDETSGSSGAHWCYF